VVDLPDLIERFERALWKVATSSNREDALALNGVGREVLEVLRRIEGERDGSSDS
jgi:hypothetical protein